MANTAYEKAVKETFEAKPLRTVLLIDDEFPTFADLAVGEIDRNGRKFRQKDRAVDLYRGFRARDMICDVENSAEGLDIERFRKSDLLILDYHLGPGESDTERSIRLLRDLASSTHFNTVVVYTAENDLAQVWLDIVSSISGGWTQFEDSLEEGIRERLDALSDEDKLPDVSREALMQYGRRRIFRQVDPGVLAAAREELVGLGVAQSAATGVLTAIIHKELGRRAGQYASEPRRETVANFDGEVYWIQTENSFVCVLRKSEGEEAGDESDRLMSHLSRALCAWRPNLVHVLASEMQNVLEAEALASSDKMLRDPITHTALWYYLLSGMGDAYPKGRSDIKPVLVEVVKKIIDGVRQRLVTDEELLGLVGDAVLGELTETGWTRDTWPKSGENEMLVGAKRIARTMGLVQKQDVFFRLNSFWSTEPFRSGYPTTGTVCWDRRSDEYLVVASPACDLVARRPNRSQNWSHFIHPLTPMMGILLRPVLGEERALAVAERGQHLFLESEVGNRVFSVLNDVGQPSFEFLFAVEEGKVREMDGRVVFDVARIVGGHGDDGAGALSGSGGELGKLERCEFDVVGQLREMNAARVMHLAGQHLSRIGLDFLNMPS